MHPLGANRAYDFLGDVALGRDSRPPLRTSTTAASGTPSAVFATGVAFVTADVGGRRSG